MSGFLASIAGATYAPPVALASVAFDGVDDYYSATGITSTATDSAYATVAITFYYDGSNGDFEGMLNLRLGAADGNWGLVVGLSGGTKVRLVRVKNFGSDGGEMYLDSAGDTALVTGGWNQVVFWHKGDSATASNSKCWVNGVPQTVFFGGTMSNTSSPYNWGHTTGQVWIGRHTTDMIGGAQPFFKGRYSQIYIHNGQTSAPSISSFWNTTTGLPRDLGTNGTATGLAQPLIYHYGNTSTFPTNNGTGFASYTLTQSGGVAGAAGATFGTFTQTNPTSFVKLGTPSAVAGYGDSGITDGVTSSATAFTFSAWVYPTLTGHTGSEWCLINLPNQDGGNASLYISIKDNGSLRFYRQVPGIEGADYSDLVSGAFPTANTWYHILITGQASSTFVVYINGIQQTNLQYGGGLSSNNFQTQILTAVRIGIADASNYAGGKGDQFTQVYFDTVNADISNNLTKFYNNGYVEMGSQGTSSGLPRPLIYHYGNTSTFATSGGRTSASSGNYLTYNLLDNDVGTIVNGT